MSDFLMHIPVFLAFLVAAILLVLALIEFGAWSVLRRRRLQLRPRLAHFRGRGVDVVAADVAVRRPVQVLRRQRPVVYCERAL